VEPGRVRLFRLLPSHRARRLPGERPAARARDQLGDLDAVRELVALVAVAGDVVPVDFGVDREAGDDLDGLVLVGVGASVPVRGGDLVEEGSGLGELLFLRAFACQHTGVDCLRLVLGQHRPRGEPRVFTGLALFFARLFRNDAF